MASSENFADRLLILMKSRGLTAISLAQGVGVSRQTVYNWINTSRITHNNLAALTAYLGVDPQWLLFGTRDALGPPAARAKGAARRRAAVASDNERLLRLAIRAAALVVWEYDVASREVRWCGAAGPLDPLLDATTLDLLLLRVDEEHRERFRLALNRLLSIGGNDQQELLLRPESGERVWAAAWTGHVADGNGRIRGLVGVLQDVTARRKAEEGLRAARTQLEERVERRTRELRAEATRRERAEQLARVERDRLHRYLLMLPALVVVLDHDGRVALLNQACERLLGYPAEEVRGRDWFDLCIPPDSREPLRRAVAQVVSGESDESAPLEIALLSRDGGRHLIAWRSTPLPGSGEAVEGAICVGSDVTAEREAERRLHLAATIVENVPEAIVVAAADWRVMAVNPAFTAMTGYSIEDLPEPTLWALDDEGSAADSVRAALEQGQSWSGQWRLRGKGDRCLLVWVSVRAVVEPGGTVANYLATLFDLGSAEAGPRNFPPLSFIDALTGLPSHELFEDRARLALLQTRRNGRKVGLLSLRIEGFAAVRADLGRNVGDHFSKLLAERICKPVRQVDSVTRLDEDHFAVLLPELESTDNLAAVAERLHTALAEPFVIGAHRLWAAVRIGTALSPEHGLTVVALLDHATRTAEHAQAVGGAAR